MTLRRFAPLSKLPAQSHIVIVGGGASGMIAAAHLLSSESSDFRVTLIEARFEPGRGVAYSTTDADHLLNTRVIQMSAYPEQPEHLLNWLQGQPGFEAVTGQDFISRMAYGDYLVNLCNQWKNTPRFAILQDEALAFDPSNMGITLASGAVLNPDLVILATGHALPEADPQGLITSAWEFSDRPEPEAQVVIIGTGLSMVDQALSLLNKGHRGPILALSRRGLMPLPHAPSKPIALTLEDLPLTSASALLHDLRARARAAEAAGGTWRDVLDAIRPFVAAIWQAWPQAERARFLRHGASLWEVHRHRIPDASHARLQEAIRSGQLRIEKAAFRRARRTEQGLCAEVRRRSSAAPELIPAALLIDCRGIKRDPRANASPIFADLYAQGLARVDALNLGPDTTPEGVILTQSGEALPGVVALGPPTRPALWEITAIPDIRVQAQALARSVIG